MGKPSITLDENLYDYLLSVSLRDSEINQALREKTNLQEMSMMQISPDQGQFMSMLIKLIRAKRIIEIGTFTGYSTLCMAQSLPDDGYIVACDISEEWTNIAKPFWKQAGVEGKIDLRIAPALDTLNQLIEQNNAGKFDFAFIDADKVNQLAYYELCLNLIKTGGLIAIDNTLWGGSVADKQNNEESTIAIREFNEFVYHDKRVDISLIPIGDGLTLAQKH